MGKGMHVNKAVVMRWSTNLLFNCTVCCLQTE